MQIDVIENGTIRLTQVFSPIVFETIGGEKLTVCMRDGVFEIGTKDPDKIGIGWVDHYNHYRVSKGIVTKL